MRDETWLAILCLIALILMYTALMLAIKAG